MFLFDLLHYSQREDSRARLELVTDPFYIGLPYFEPTEVDAVQGARGIDGKPLSQVLGESLSQRLERRQGKREESGDFRVCAAHDLAPTLGRLLGIDLKQLSKDKAFVRLVDANGLDLGNARFDGLTAKSFAPKKKKKKR